MTQDIRDPFAVDGTDDFDPFASAEDAASRGGPFIPWPKITYVQDRLVVLVPRSFDKEAKVSEYAQRTYGMKPTQETWTVDLVILDGPLPLEYGYRAKVEGQEGQYEEATFAIDELPALITGWRVTPGNMIGTLNRVSELPTPFALGRIRAGYSAKEMRAGRTFEEFAQSLQAFYANPRGKTQPKAVWHFVISEAPADKALALSWWKSARADGFKV